MRSQLKTLFVPIVIAIVITVVACFFQTHQGQGSVSTDSASQAETQDVVYSEGGLASLPLGPSMVLAKDKVELGLALFKDARLSRDNSVSCNNCHHLDGYGVDNLTFSVGVGGQLGEANSPSVFNATLNFRQFWDGRAANLREQIQGPIHNPKEMGTEWADVLTKLKQDAPLLSLFKKAYGTEPSEENVIDAITTFESALITPNAPFDRYLRGERGAMTAQQIVGFKKFQVYGCVACHQGANVGGNMYQTLGVMGDYFKDRGGSFPSDAGRFGITKKPEDLHVFRVPSLRNVAKTAPYFHDGQVKTLDKAVALMGHYQLGRDLSKDDVSDIVTFLDSLTGELPAILVQRREVANEKAH